MICGHVQSCGYVFVLRESLSIRALKPVPCAWEDSRDSGPIDHDLDLPQRPLSQTRHDQCSDVGWFDP